MTVGALLNQLFPFVNEQGFNYFTSEEQIYAIINDAIGFVYNYHLWTWRFIKEDYVLPNNNVEVTGNQYKITTQYPIYFIQKIFINDREIDLTKDLTGTYQYGNLKYTFLDNKLTLEYSGNIQKISIIYIKGYKFVKTLTDVIDIPPQFGSALKYLILSFLTPLYPNIDTQFIQLYFNQAMTILNTLKIWDDNWGKSLQFNSYY